MGKPKSLSANEEEYQSVRGVGVVITDLKRRVGGVRYLDSKEIALFAAILCGVELIVVIICQSIRRMNRMALVGDGLEAF